MSITDRLKENNKERRKEPSREARSLAIELVESESEHGASSQHGTVSTAYQQILMCIIPLVS